MNTIVPVVVLLVYFLQGCVAPPVTVKNNTDQQHVGDSDIGGLEDYMEYHRYLKEVVNALESDPEFRTKLEKAEESDIKSGKIADELAFVSHHVRTRLDEIKRVELNRLKELTEKKRQLQENIDLEDPTHHHLDHANIHTFEIEDLKKLIAKTTEDLAEADRKRRDEFKQYELQKEFDKQNKLNHTNGSERDKLEKEYKEAEEKHKKHEKLHEPGHKAQFEQVWEEQDQMQQEFDPKTFFMLHDVDSNGLWDQDEVKALFVKELEKMYVAGEPEDDMRERAEEMERMRESVFREVDLNRDGFIDYKEFLAQTKRNDYQQDHGWQGIDERRPYTDEELQAYIQHQQQMNNHIPQGYPPQHYQGQPPPGAYQQVPPGYHPNQQVPQGYHPNQQGYHPNQQIPQGYHPNAVPVQQFHPGQVPQQHPQQLPGHLPELNTNEVYPQSQGGQGYQQQPQGHQQVPQQQFNNQQQQFHNQQQQQAPPSQVQNHNVPAPQNVNKQGVPQQQNNDSPAPYQPGNVLQHPPQLNNPQQPPQHPPQLNNPQLPPQHPPQLNNQQQPPQLNNQQQSPQQQVHSNQQPPQNPQVNKV